MVAVNFKEKLAQQLRFLRRSCNLFDDGDREEAIRIATSIRIIFHQTRSSIALLTHLDAWAIDIASTIRFPAHTPADTLLQMSPLYTIRVDLQNEVGNPTIKVSSEPYGRAEIRDEDKVPARDWWNQVLYILPDGKTYSRREIVLDAANKDGGAHVDDKLPDLYYYASRKVGSVSIRQNLNTGEAIFNLEIGLHSDGHGDFTGIVNDAHLSDLRQIAEELLCSGDLLKIVN